MNALAINLIGVGGGGLLDVELRPPAGEDLA